MANPFANSIYFHFQTLISMVHVFHVCIQHHSIKSNKKKKNTMFQKQKPDIRNLFCCDFSFGSFYSFCSSFTFIIIYVILILYAVYIKLIALRRSGDRRFTGTRYTHHYLHFSFPFLFFSSSSSFRSNVRRIRRVILKLLVEPMLCISKSATFCKKKISFKHFFDLCALNSAI